MFHRFNSIFFLFCFIIGCSTFDIPENTAIIETYQTDDKADDQIGVGTPQNEKEKEAFSYSNDIEISPSNLLLTDKVEKSQANVGNQEDLDGLKKILESFTKFDINKDGSYEIIELYLHYYLSMSCYPHKDAKLLAVLVEPSLLTKIDGSDYYVDDLLGSFQTFEKDLFNEGYCPIFIVTKVYNSTPYGYDKH